MCSCTLSSFSAGRDLEQSCVQFCLRTACRVQGAVAHTICLGGMTPLSSSKVVSHVSGVSDVKPSSCSRCLFSWFSWSPATSFVCACSCREGRAEGSWHRRHGLQSQRYLLFGSLQKMFADSCPTCLGTPPRVSVQSSASSEHSSRLQAAWLLWPLPGDWAGLCCQLTMCLFTSQSKRLS